MAVRDALLSLDHNLPGWTNVAALPLWEDYGGLDWLIMDCKSHPPLNGRVIRLSAGYNYGTFCSDDIAAAAMEKWELPFLDWLSANAQRYALGVGDDKSSKEFYDEAEGLWKPNERYRFQFFAH